MAGGDPSGVKALRKQAPSTDDLADRFLTDHADTKRKAATAAQYRRLLNQFIRPAFGRKKAADVTRTDVLRLHAGMQRTPYQANRVLALVSTLFSFAELIEVRPQGSNPARGIERFPETARERLLSPVELACLGESMRDALEAGLRGRSVGAAGGGGERQGEERRAEGGPCDRGD